MSIETLPILFSDVVNAIQSCDNHYAVEAQHRLNSLTKPIGSLGQLEEIAAQLYSIFSGAIPRPLHRAVYVFAADHGVTSEGVSAYPREVTAQMVLNFVSGGAAINVLARAHQAALSVVDVGVDADFEEAKGMIRAKVRRGSRNMRLEAAMSEEEMFAALQVGVSVARAAHGRRETLVAVGEMGIGNTTAASAIAAMLTHQSVDALTGNGTGLDTSGRARKQQVIVETLQHHFGTNKSPDALEVLRCVGGLEIAAMTGFILGAASLHIAVICDGFISTAAAAVAQAVAPAVQDYLFAGHCSEEPGHRPLLQLIGISPILNLGMRLGEGTGAVLAMPLIESAACLMTEMATFQSAGVSEAKQA